MALFARTQPILDITKTNTLLYSFPKTGKTRLASTMIDSAGREPLFLASEDGHGSVRVSSARVNSWDGMLKCVDFLEANVARIKNEHSCIVLDVTTDFDAWCSTYVAQKKKVEYVGDMEQGKGWKLLNDEFQRVITRIMTLAPVTFIAHAQEKRVKVNGEEAVTVAPALSKGAMNYINGKVDQIMFIVPSSSKKLVPEVSMWPNSAYIAGARQTALCRSFSYDPANPGKTWQEIAALYAQAQAQNPVDQINTATA